MLGEPTEPRNPYASANLAAVVRDPSIARLNAVSRILVWIGLLGSLVSLPMTIGSLVCLIAYAIGYPLRDPKIATAWVLTLSCLVHGGLLSLWLTFIVTARQVRWRVYTARRRALALSMLLIFGFPLLTLPGICCYRWIARYFSPFYRGIPEGKSIAGEFDSRSG